jgi:hypothetical protein
MLEHCPDLISCESILSPRTAEVSLLGQISLSEDDRGKLERLISSRMARDPNEATAFLRDKAPASLCCFLVGMGVRNYQGGDYWSALHQMANLPVGPIWQIKWGQIFLAYLQRKGLPTFSDSGGHRYVTPILAHGGIPDYCLRDFFHNLLFPIISGRLEVDITDAEEILQEWQERPSLFLFTDAPVRRFLLHGGKVAADFLSRCIEMAQRAYEEGEVPEVEELEIPPRIVQRFEQWLQAERVSPPTRATHARFRRPVILLAPEFGEVSMQIPPQAIQDDARVAALRVEIIPGREEAFQVTLRSNKRDGLIETEEAQVRLPSPAEKYEVRFLSGNQMLRAWSFKGLTQERPWMAFVQTSHSMLPIDEPPCSTFWLLCPKRYRMHASVSIVEEGSPLYGRWAHYRACLLQATSGKDVPLLDESAAEIILPVASEHAAEPALVGGELLPLVSCEGQPVYSTAPSLRIPRSADQLARWHLSIIPHGRATLATRKDLNLADMAARTSEGGVVEFSLAGQALVGSRAAGQFVIRLRGPLGDDRRFRLALIPGLTIAFDKAVYVPAHDTAPAAQLTIALESVADILVEEPCSLIEKRGTSWILKVPGTESRVRCTVCIPQPSGEALEVPLMIHVPRLGIAMQGLAGERTWQWSHVPREITLEQWEESEELFLLVNVPGIDEGDVTVALPERMQVVTQRLHQAKVRFELKQFSDTLKALGQPLSRFDLSVTKNGTTLQEIPALGVRTQWAVEGLREDQAVSDGQRVVRVQWKDRGRVRNRMIRFWNLWRPWALPIESHIPDGHETILNERPVEELPSGAYCIEFISEDPWIGSPPVGLAPAVDGQRVFSCWIGDNQDRSVSRSPLSGTFQSSLEQLAAQRLAKFGILEQEIKGVSLADPLTDADLEAMAGLLVSWLPDNEPQAYHAKTLWDHAFWGYQQRVPDHVLAVRFLLALGRFTSNRAATVKERAKRLCLLIGLMQMSLRGIERPVAESERNAVWDLWPVIGLALDLADPDLNEAGGLVRRLIRVLGERPLKDILDWPTTMDTEWPVGCPGDFAECLLCRLGVDRQCKSRTELRYSIDYYGGRETRDLDQLVAIELGDLQQILGALQLYPMGLLHPDTHLEAIANWILQMKTKNQYPTLYKWVQEQLTQCQIALGEVRQQEWLQPLVRALYSRLLTPQQNAVCNVPFLVGSIALIQRLMAWGLL